MKKYLLKLNKFLTRFRFNGYKKRFINKSTTENLNQAIDSLTATHLSVFWGDRMLTLDKTAGFLNDNSFKTAFTDIYDNHKYDQYDGKDTIAWRLNTLCWAAKCALKVEGSFVECGVFKGDMAWVILQVVGASNISKYYLYDSFEGFSDKYSSQNDYPLIPGFFNFANSVYREPGIFESVIARYKDYKNVEIIQGFLPESLDKVKPTKISFLHIDLNSPKAEVEVLDQLFDLVVPGGVIIFDDYGWKLFESQKNAEDIFMHKRGYEILELPTGQGLVFKR